MHALEVLEIGSGGGRGALTSLGDSVTSKQVCNCLILGRTIGLQEKAKARMLYLCD